MDRIMVMGYIKRFGSVTVSAFIPFVLLAWLGKQLFSYQLHQTLNPNEFTFNDLRVYFSHVMPLLYASAVLMQLLFTAKLFNKFDQGNHFNRKRFIKIALLVMSIVSIALSILVWQKEASILLLMKSVYRLFVVQLVYWLLSLSAAIITNRLLRLKPKSYFSNLTSL